MFAKERLQLTAAPQLISLDDAEVQHAKQECLRLLHQSEELESPATGLALRMVRSSAEEGYYFLHDARKKDVLYLVRFRRVGMGSKLGLPHGNHAGRQVLVWRNSRDAATAGLAYKVFWRYLFAEFKVLVSDSQQTESGKAFWQYQIADALKNGLTVELVNSNDWSKQEVHSLDQFIELQDGVWGKMPWFHRMIILIY